MMPVIDVWARVKMEAGAGIEPAMEVLQTSALPLGHPAMDVQKKGPYGPETGAGNRVRTGDLNLGKVALYQLSYSRTERNIF